MDIHEQTPEFEEDAGLNNFIDKVILEDDREEEIDDVPIPPEHKAPYNVEDILVPKDIMPETNDASHLDEVSQIIEQQSAPLDFIPNEYNGPTSHFYGKLKPVVKIVGPAKADMSALKAKLKELSELDCINDTHSMIERVAILNKTLQAVIKFNHALIEELEK